MEGRGKETRVVLIAWLRVQPKTNSKFYILNRLDQGRVMVFHFVSLLFLRGGV